MSDTPAENRLDEVETPAEPETKSDDKQVPLEAHAKLRKEKRALSEKNEQLSEELKNLKEQIPQLDVEALIKNMADITATQAEAAVQAAVKPLQDEVSQHKAAMGLGLTEAQAEAWRSIKQEHPTLSDERALQMVRLEKPDLFPQQTQRPTIDPSVGGMPASGLAPARSQGDQADFMAKMREAETPAERKHWAQEEFKRRVLMRWKPETYRPSQQ